MSALAIVPITLETISGLSRRLAELLERSEPDGVQGQVTRLKGFLFAFMTARGIKKLEGEKSDIGMQRNSNASLVVDDPLQIAEHFFERNVRFTKAELQEIVYQLAEGEVRRRLELALKDGWEVNGGALRAGLVNNEQIAGARLVTGSHIRIR